ncbi:hypothetical protein B0H13DRAFT_1899628 [Mycena leptocephala]|nr:hypothetical protein B0H13DRAFT_1899628 [Mycena leptocephala]
MLGRSHQDVEEQAGRIRWTGIKRGGRLAARRSGKLRNTLKGGCSECPESQSDGTAPNETAWSALAVTVRSRREGVNGGDRLCQGVGLPEANRQVEERRCGYASESGDWVHILGTGKRHLEWNQQQENSRTHTPAYDGEEPGAVPPPATRITEPQSEGSDSAPEDS